MNFLWSLGATIYPDLIDDAGTSPEPVRQNPFEAMNPAFRNGVDYNMKVVIRGDLMTGKSALFQRLQGQDLDVQYTSTSQIQVANIQWRYKHSSNIIKVELWDIVDRAPGNILRKRTTGIKLEHDQPRPEVQPAPAQHPQLANLALDASNVNIYRNTHAVIFLFDITKPWTFDYVNRELSNIPDTLSVLVLGNFNDKSEDRVVSMEEIHATLYLHNNIRINRGASKSNLICYADSSMADGLGLRYINNYLAVPFLQLQMETLKKQLELKSFEIVDTLAALDTSNMVPDMLRRKRNQDNFDQPSKPHLARQQQRDTQQTWDSELQEIADDYEPPAFKTFVSSTLQSSTSSSSTAPTTPQRRNGSFSSDDNAFSLAADQFDASTLEDDWFKDDPVTPNALSFSHAPQDSDDEDTQNPMVACDEDAVELRNEHARSVPKTRIANPIHQYSENESEKGSKPPEVPRLHSTLENVWDSHAYSTGHFIQSSHIHPESKYDDDANLDSINEAVGDSFVEFGYQEIGDDSSNPWSNDPISKQVDLEVSQPRSNMVHSSAQEMKKSTENSKSKKKTKRSAAKKKKNIVLQ